MLDNHQVLKRLASFLKIASVNGNLDLTVSECMLILNKHEKSFYSGVWVPDLVFCVMPIIANKKQNIFLVVRAYLFYRDVITSKEILFMYPGNTTLK
jgi:hypothetical protein